MSDLKECKIDTLKSPIWT